MSPKNNLNKYMDCSKKKKKRKKKKKKKKKIYGRGGLMHLGA